jgi:hypothetical protein
MGKSLPRSSASAMGTGPPVRRFTYDGLTLEEPAHEPEFGSLLHTVADKSSAASHGKGNQNRHDDWAKALYGLLYAR